MKNHSSISVISQHHGLTIEAKRKILGSLLCVLFVAIFAVRSTIGQTITDAQKQQNIIAMVNNHRGSLPSEFVLSEIFQEGGQGAFYVNGYLYNSFYRQADAPWAQPSNNSDGIMQVTSASGYHNHNYTNDFAGYDYAITDGCGYLLVQYNQYGTVWQSALHYNTGPNSLYIYKRNQGDPNYLTGIANQLTNRVPTMFGITNAALADKMTQAQQVLNGYLNNPNILSNQSVSYYSAYQTQLDNDLHNLLNGPADLALQPLSVTHGTFHPGDHVTIPPSGVTVINLGGAMSAAYTISYYLSTNSTITPSDTFLETSQVWPGIPGGGTTSFEGFLTIPSTIVSGNYYVGAIVNVTDANASNNVNYDPVAITVSTTQTGSLQVTIGPSGAVNAGAQWQVDGGSYQNSGATVNGLTVGNHSVAFKSISGWTKPSNQTVAINANATTQTSGTYVASPSPTPTATATATAKPTPTATPTAPPQVEPPTVQTVAASPITPNSAVLNGRVLANGGEAIDHYFFFYWADPNSPIAIDDSNIIVNGNDFAAKITGLVPGAAYQYRAYAHNSSGANIGWGTGWGAGASVAFTAGNTIPMPNGAVVAFVANANGLIVTAENGGNNPLIANRGAIGQWEQFQIIDLGTGYVALRSMANGLYVTAENGGASPLVANRGAVGTWEQFQLVDTGGGKFAFNARANGLYVTAENGGNSSLIANRSAVGGWEQFSMMFLPSGIPGNVTLGFQSIFNNNYITAENGGASSLAANRASEGGWEQFRIEPQNDGYVAIRSLINGMYVTAENGGNGPLIANRGGVGTWERFQFFDTGNGTVALRALANGLYVSAVNGGSQLIANRYFVGAGEQFNLMISLRALANNQFVTAENGGANPLIANRSAIGTWEQFQFISSNSVNNVSPGYFALKAKANGKYVTAENGGNSALIANREGIGTWEQFQWIIGGNGNVAIKALVNGLFVTAENGGAGSLIANRGVASTWEQFR
ncbi:MAG TPA: RICIN domain-containing protein [Chthoniobacterales bacterium]|jgi:hypothetical protein|nr:RICIN domain-containing protein [Chthoniobacterales bacterium]